MTISIGTHIQFDGLPVDDAARWLAACTFVNPKYEASARYTRTGKPARGLEPSICLAGLPIGKYMAGTACIFPRGLASQVAAEYPAATITDNTSFPQARERIQTSGALVPRDYQQAAADAVIQACGGVIHVPTGQGKTVIALHLAERLQTRTLILVHTGVLLDQAVQRCRDFLGIEPGVIGEGTWRPGGLVTVAMLQTLASRSRAADVAAMRDRFGMVILDEAHIAPADTFRHVVQQFSARYRVGLTATPKRKDGLHPILFAVIGPIVFALKARSLPLESTRVDTGWTCDPLPMRKQPRRRPQTLADLSPRSEVDHTELLNRLCADPTRTRLVVDTICREHRGASLVLTERVAHVREIADALVARGLSAVALAGTVTGKGKAAKRKAVTDGERADAVGGIADGRYDVLVSTPAMVGVGFDCPRLDTLFLACPHGNPVTAEQTAGRVTRPFDGKAAGRVVDFVDGDVGPLMGQWHKRRAVYRRLQEV